MNEVLIGQFIVEFFVGIIDFSIMYYVSTRNSHKKIRNNYLAMTGLIFLSGLIAYFKITLGVSSIIGTVIPIIGLFLLVRLNYDVNSFKVVYIFGSILLMISIATISTILIFQLFVNTNPLLLMNHNYYRIFYRIMTKILEIVPIFLLSKLLLKEKIIISYYSVVTLIILISNFVLTFIGIKYYSNSDPSDKVGFLYVILALAIFTILNIMVVYLTRGIIISERKELRWEDLKKEYESQLIFLKEINNLFTSIRKQRHDYIIHIEAINSLLNNSDFTEAKEYSNNLLRTEEKIASKIRIENKIISSIINFKEKKASESNIDTNYYINVPKEIRIDDIDITIILSNALNNAIEACEKLNEGKYIDIYMNYKFEKLKIEIKNSFDGKINESIDLIKTTKLDRLEHGLGLRNMIEVVEKYDGIIEIKIEEKEFILALMI